MVKTFHLAHVVTSFACTHTCTYMYVHVSTYMYIHVCKQILGLKVFEIPTCISTSIQVLSKVLTTLNRLGLLNYYHQSLCKTGAKLLSISSKLTERLNIQLMFIR